MAHPNSLKNLVKGNPPRAEAPSKVVTFRLSPAELRRVCEAAHLNRVLVATFVRDAIMTATDDCLEKPDGS